MGTWAWEGESLDEDLMTEVEFPLGQIVATRGALCALRDAGQLPGEFLSRHQRGDWGIMCEEDKIRNELALRRGGRLMSAYVLMTGVKIWLVTEADRSSSTLLLPDEY